MAERPRIDFAVNFDIENHVVSRFRKSVCRVTDRLRVEVKDRAIERLGLDLESMQSCGVLTPPLQLASYLRAVETRRASSGMHLPAFD
jgi:hypothetical protein